MTQSTRSNLYVYRRFVIKILIYFKVMTFWF